MQPKGVRRQRSNGTGSIGLDGFDQPDLAVVGCADHRALAAELAERSVTLVRDDAGLLPLAPGADDRILAVMPAPRDLTPADTSAKPSTTRVGSSS